MATRFRLAEQQVGLPGSGAIEGLGSDSRALRPCLSQFGSIITTLHSSAGVELTAYHYSAAYVWRTARARCINRLSRGIPRLPW